MAEKMETQFKGVCHPAQKQAWEKAAALSKRSFSDWARIILDEAAEAAIAEAEAKAAKKKPAK
jgi:hypothetical protein